MSGAAAVIVVAIAVPAIAIGTRSSTPSVPPATIAVRRGDFVARVVKSAAPLSDHFGGPCIGATDGKYCYVLGETIMTARDVVSARAIDDVPPGWLVLMKVHAVALRRIASQVGRQIAFIVAGRVVSAPTIDAGITGTNVEIATGHLTHAQATQIAAEIMGRTPPADTVTTSIDLPDDPTYAAGTEVHGTLVIDNETGAPWPRPVDKNGCETKWAIVLTNSQVPPMAAFSADCILRVTLPTGVTRLPFTMITTYETCPTASRPCTSSGSMPTLPLGRYTAVMYGGQGWPPPHGVAVRLVTAW